MCCLIDRVYCSLLAVFFPAAYVATQAEALLAAQQDAKQKVAKVEAAKAALAAQEREQRLRSELSGMGVKDLRARAAQVRKRVCCDAILY